MRILWLVLIGLFTFAWSPRTAEARDYSTFFGATETPISESSNWTNGGTTGLLWTNVNTTPGKAFGTQSGTQTCNPPAIAGCNDSTAIVSGTWAGAAQWAQGTVFNTSNLGSAFGEVEIRINTTITANSNTGYECIFSVVASNPYVQIVKWNGGLGSFTYLNSTSAGSPLVTGDKVSCQRSGTFVMLRKNGTTLLSVNDTTYLGGSPGVGFYLDGATGVNNKYGFSSFVATDHNIVNTPTCSNTDVQAAVTAASTGDVIIVAPGNCSWTSTVTVTGKALTIVGGGRGVTNVTCNGSGRCLNITASPTNFVEVSEITFIDGTGNVDGAINVGGTQFSVAFRLHHNTFSQAVAGARLIATQDVYGLIDHNNFNTPSVSSQAIAIRGGSIGGADGGYIPWTQPLTLGSNKAVYIEDNTFTRTATNFNAEDAIDAYSGARLVLRFNTFTNAHAGFHGTDSGLIRSPVSFEIYNNTYTNSTTVSISGGRARGGTGVIFNNTWSHSSTGTWNDFQLLVYRACSPDASSWDVCNGTQYKILDNVLSTNNSRTCSTSGTFGFNSVSLDALPICTHGVGNCTAFFDGAGTGGYPCRDQPGRAPGQVLDPVYGWNNTGAQISGADAWASNCNGFGLTTYLQSGRDYINNGTTAKPGYTAYTYPHPNQASGGGAISSGPSSDTTPPSIPANVRVSSLGIKNVYNYGLNP